MGVQIYQITTTNQNWRKSKKKENNKFLNIFTYIEVSEENPLEKLMCKVKIDLNTSKLASHPFKDEENIAFQTISTV